MMYLCVWGGEGEPGRRTHSRGRCSYVHIGGDEVSTLQCWSESAKVQVCLRRPRARLRTLTTARAQAFMKAHSIPDVNAVSGARAHAIAGAARGCDRWGPQMRNYFETTVQNIIISHNASAMVWEEVCAPCMCSCGCVCV